MTHLTGEHRAEATQRSTLLDVLRRRRPTLIAAAATVASLALIAPSPAVVQTYVSAWGVLVAAVIYLAWGSARGESTRGPLLRAQTFGVLLFGAIALLAVAVSPASAHFVLAAGWLGHAAWDVAHHRIGRVVPRWYAEACLVSDVIVASALLATAFV